MLWATLRIAGVQAGTRLQIRRWDLPWASTKNIWMLTDGKPTFVSNVTAALSSPTWHDPNSFAATTVVFWKVFGLSA